jgi:hypothetical protein
LYSVAAGTHIKLLDFVRSKTYFIILNNANKSENIYIYIYIDICTFSVDEFSSYQLIPKMIYILVFILK